VPAEQCGLPLGLAQAAAAHEHLRPELAVAGVGAAGVGAVGLEPVQCLAGPAEVGGVAAQLQQALAVPAAVAGGGERARGVDEQADRLLAGGNIRTLGQSPLARKSRPKMVRPI
jgi:hypothetical protein